MSLQKRDHRLVNWDCILRTAISDIEVDYKDIKERTLLKVPGYENPVEFGVMTSFAYPLEGGLEKLVVATTRVETMLGGTAIAVRPTDKRYRHIHGKFAIHPFNGRKIPIVCDEILLDPAFGAFGTGAVKITPAHDPNDFEVGKRHNLEFISILTNDGRINSNGGPEFEGMPRFEARVALIEALKKKGLYVGVQNKEMRLGLCSRTNDVVEPMIKPQWFVDCKDMANEALDAVIDDKKKKIEIIPKQYTAEWKRWLENIRDWCISRQLWWGHRIPAWYVTIEDDDLKEFGACKSNWVVGRNEEEALFEANKIANGKKFQMSQDPDVLDTWFSSGLFPLSVLGWPDKSEDFKVFYPTSVLETGHDILFFWVARMVMLGMKLGGDVPFRKVSWLFINFLEQNGFACLDLTQIEFVAATIIFSIIFLLRQTMRKKTPKKPIKITQKERLKSVEESTTLLVESNKLVTKQLEVMLAKVRSVYCFGGDGRFVDAIEDEVEIREKKIVEKARLVAGVMTKDSKKFVGDGLEIKHLEETTEREVHRTIDLVGGKDGDMSESSRLKDNDEVVTLMRGVYMANQMGMANTVEEFAVVLYSVMHPMKRHAFQMMCYPIHLIYLHPMIRDAHGRKMSKSLGNVIDPLEVINGISLEGLHKRLEEGNLDPSELVVAKEGQKKDYPNGITECGADALRFALVSYTAQSDKINLDIQRVVGYRQWCNKLWQAVIFAMGKLGDNYTPADLAGKSMPFICKWILSVLNKAISKTVTSLDSYEFSDAATAVYSWWQFQLCDVFIEATKPYFSKNGLKSGLEFDSERNVVRDTLWVCLDNGLRLLHPFMPYVTEELWQRLPQADARPTRKSSIMISEYPTVLEEWTNEKTEAEMNLVELTRKSLKSLSNERCERRPSFALCRTKEIADIIRSRELEISTLASFSSFEVILSETDARLDECAVAIINEHLSVYLQLGTLNAQAELEKLQKNREEIQKQHDILQKKMTATGYEQKVPLHIQEQNATKRDKFEQELGIIVEAMRNLESKISNVCRIVGQHSGADTMDYIEVGDEARVTVGSKIQSEFAQVALGAQPTLPTDYDVNIPSAGENCERSAGIIVKARGPQTTKM
ncbi:hypothetical protein GIB67_003530 [Kingdonia uniflora]|uniref:Valine--tRNA ligase, mitochondrial n=1 Tax=Kingdonia uniflora TaxID=39325 RepID=A0A7J7MEV4_9MAGN|nr:hypothetical protein GIB67_003530 [Kingdonia uniflora]